MRHYTLIHLFALPLIALAVASCAHGNPEYVDFPVREDVPAFCPTYETTSDIMDEAPWDVFGQEYAEELAADQAGPQAAPSATDATTTDIISIVRGLVDMTQCHKIHQVAGTYRSLDVYYSDITLSGKVFYPEKGDIKNIILVSHFTIGANFECPSETFALEGLLATKGYLVVEPDYIGYGVTRDLVHPYLNSTITANNVIDMLEAVRAWIPQREDVKNRILSDSIILFGYSQGGATTMHVQSLMEGRNESYDTPKYKIKRNYCGSGPYDVALTYDLSIKNDVTGIPCAVPMIIQGVSEGMATPLDMAYFFREPLLSNYKDWLNSKKYTVKQINLLINAKRLSEILTAEGCDKRSEETQRLYRRLSENSVSPFYVPKANIYLFHSMDDATVPFINGQEMQIQFTEAGCTNVEYDFGHYGSHTTGMLKFLIKCMKKL